MILLPVAALLVLALTGSASCERNRNLGEGQAGINGASPGYSAGIAGRGSRAGAGNGNYTVLASTSTTDSNEGEGEGGGAADSSGGAGVSITQSGTPKVEMSLSLVEDLEVGDQGEEWSQGAGAQTEPLSEQDIERVLAMVPADQMARLKEVDGTDRQEFALPAQTSPPELTGATILTPFPPEEGTEAAPTSTPTSAPGTAAAGAADQSALKVIRVVPEGEVDGAPFISVAFSHPMIPLGKSPRIQTGSLAPASAPGLNMAAALQATPPLPPGQWRWLGTSTAVFEPAEGRLPMATSYTLKLKAGLQSADGGAQLADDHTWSLTTPPLTLTHKLPSGQEPQSLQPLIYLEFNGMVNPQEALPHIKLIPLGEGAALPVRLASNREMKDNARVSAVAKAAFEGQWMVVTPKSSLPLGTVVRVEVGPEIPSAEGLLTPGTKETFTFKTYGELAVAGTRCGFQGQCREGDHWTVNFTNPLDSKKFKQDMVTVEPPLSGVKAAVMGDTLTITGRSRALTTYKVKLSPEIRDSFNQSLADGGAGASAGELVVVEFSIDPATPALAGPGKEMVVLKGGPAPKSAPDQGQGEPAGGGDGPPLHFPVVTNNVQRLKVKLFKVEPASHWSQFLVSTGGYGGRRPPGLVIGRSKGDTDGKSKSHTHIPPGELVFEQEVSVADYRANQWMETMVDLAPALNVDQTSGAGYGHVVVLVEPAALEQGGAGEARGQSEQEQLLEAGSVYTWVQVTQLAVDGVFDSTSTVAWVNSLNDGRPVDGAAVQVFPGGARGKTDQGGLARVLHSARPGKDVVSADGADSAATAGDKESGNQTVAPLKNQPLKPVVRANAPRVSVSVPKPAQVAPPVSKALRVVPKPTRPGQKEQDQEQEQSWDPYVLVRYGADSAFLPMNGLDYRIRLATKDDSRVGSGAAAPGANPDELRWYVFDDRKMYRPGEQISIKGWVRRVINRPDGDLSLWLARAPRFTYRAMDGRGNVIHEGSGLLNRAGGFHLTMDLPQDMNLGWCSVVFTLTDPGANYRDELTGLTYYHQFTVEEFRRPRFQVQVTRELPPVAQGAGAAHTDTRGEEGGIPPAMAGEELLFRGKAAYYAGGGLPLAPIGWRAETSLARYAPPGWDRFIFGEHRPWWMPLRGTGGARWPGIRTAPLAVLHLEGQTDHLGHSYASLTVNSVSPARPISVSLQAQVEDQDRQKWSDTARVLVHPASLYVGLRPQGFFSQADQSIQLEVIVTDLDGKPVEDRPVQVTASRLEQIQEEGEWRERQVGQFSCQVKSGDRPQACSIELQAQDASDTDSAPGGTYRVVATVKDDQGRANETVLTLWVADSNTAAMGRGPGRVGARGIAQDTVTLIPEQESFQVGQEARILVQAPFAPADGLLTVARSGIVKVEHFHMEGDTHTITLPIKEEHIPNLVLTVDLVGTKPGSITTTTTPTTAGPQASWVPAFATGTLDLQIPLSGRRLDVKVSPDRPMVVPGAESTVQLEVTDWQGEPVPGAEVALVVVDEAVLGLSGYQVPDPLELFYQARSGDTTNYAMREHVLIVDPEELIDEAVAGGAGGSRLGFARQRVMAMGAGADLMEMASPAAGVPMLKSGDAAPGAGGQAQEGAQTLDLRQDFNPLALFAPDGRTDSQGKITVQFKMPDNLTRYRLTGVVVSGGNLFGMGSSNITAQLPLMVRPSPPRFLNYGDHFQLSVTVQNNTESPLQVDVAVAGANARATRGGSTAGYRVTVPPSNRALVSFPMGAEDAGTASFLVAAATAATAAQAGPAGAAYTDGALLTIPVWTPATTEAFATYGQLDAQGQVVSQPVAIPGEVVPRFGGIRITTSSTAVQELADAYLYLRDYPFSFPEGLASRVLAASTAGQAIDALNRNQGHTRGTTRDELITKDLEKLQSLQNHDGGFGLWGRGGQSWPFLSVHAAHAMVRASQAGFTVPAPMYRSAMQYVKRVGNKLPREYGPALTRSIQAYALYVRTLEGEHTGELLRTAHDLVHKEGGGVGTLPVEAGGWLLSVASRLQAAGHGDGGKLKTELLSHLSNRLVETGSTVYFTESYGKGQGNRFLLHSNPRTDAVVLDALLTANSGADLMPKLVRGLLGFRKKGRWDTTQENAFVLLALGGYFNKYEGVIPDGAVHYWLEDHQVATHRFQGRTPDRKQVELPMDWLLGEVGEAGEGAPRAPEEGGDRSSTLVLRKEGAGRFYYRLAMDYAPASLMLDPVESGFTVEREYLAVDHPDHVQRLGDGSWQIKAGATVAVRLTMAAQSRRYHVALVDSLPAGLEPLNPALAVTGVLPDQDGWGAGDGGSDGSGAPGFRWWFNWYEHQNMKDDRMEVFASYLWEGVHTYTYFARATTPGQFIVPPLKAEELYSPETFGRSATHLVRVVE